MIKAAGAQQDGKPLLVLGLSRANVDRLLNGWPIFITPEELVGMGLPELSVMVLGGETEQAISEQLGRPMPQPESGESFRSGSPRAPHGRRA